MTAAELYEVVKDVPREAWPELTWDGVEWSNSRRDEDISARIAEHAFIGSMTAWLLRTCDIVETRSTPWGSVECTTCGEEHRVEASSLVAARAAACKEVSNDG